MHLGVLAEMADSQLTGSYGRSSPRCARSPAGRAARASTAS
jgi:hypothetical protein